MISPINYIIPQADLGSKLQNLGTVLGENRQRDKEEARLLAKEEEAKQLKLKYQADLKATFDDPTPKNIAILTANYPAQREAFKQAFDGMSEEQKKNETAVVGQVYSALTSGNNEVALKVINKEIEAVKNSNGDTKKLEGIRDSIETNPKGATLMAGLAYDALLGGKDFSKVVESQSSEQRKKELHPIEVKKAKADLKKLAVDMNLTKAQTNEAYANIRKTNIEAKAVMMEAIRKKNEIKAVSPVKLSTGGEKLLNDSVIAASNSYSLASQYENLANEIDDSLATTGTAGKATEAIKKVWGNQDRVTRLRQEYIRLKNSGVLKMLPAGPATDKDIEIAQKAFPDDNANPKYIASFMRGLSKLQKYDGKLSETKADWIGANGTLGRTTNDVNIGNKQVSKGTSFSEYARGTISVPSVTNKSETPPENNEKNIKTIVGKY